MESEISSLFSRIHDAYFISEPKPMINDPKSILQISRASIFLIWEKVLFLVSRQAIEALKLPA